jgi:hypothetical protein
VAHPFALFAKGWVRTKLIHQQLHAALPAPKFVISTEAKRSGETSVFVFALVFFLSFPQGICSFRVANLSIDPVNHPKTIPVYNSEKTS